ncbi:hypothetical protein J8273_3805 [Carpediemonas membranifera]|uniref:Uncharacterized protein n=1 Tax=Carpediemonas membranifera TaxID=201153 RepID=A0A8J6BCH7_9EUKA|nr:hypothetical protein J8273_3805 [Carpediemonas membranifera]|eukprot:KAG9394557.1 hypothetical protein J8273_3805 [Carpediemonas membranifera]
MTGSENEALDAKEALIFAYALAEASTNALSGDVPSLLRHAYSRHFNQVMPSVRDQEIHRAPESSATLETLSVMLTAIPPLAPKAQVLLDRAQSILTDGPPLSMNVELAEGEELPVALHTLLQGTLWALLMAAGANPDLEDTFTGASKLFSAYAKLLWFICRKFYFTLTVALKDGTHTEPDHPMFAIHRIYAGKLTETLLFPQKTDITYPTKLVRCPPVKDAFGMGGADIILATTRGLYGVNRSDGTFRTIISYDVDAYTLGFDIPTKLDFSLCPKVNEFEKSLPLWHKDEILMNSESVYHEDEICLILTPVGAVAAGFEAQYIIGDVSDDHTRFHPIPLPVGFIPDHAMLSWNVTILSMGDRQMIGGTNFDGQLGLRHFDALNTAVPLPYHVDKILTNSLDFMVVQSSNDVLFSGDVPDHIAKSGLLPDFIDGGTTSTPLKLEVPAGKCIHSFFCNIHALIIVYDDGSTFCARETSAHDYHEPSEVYQLKLPYEVTEVGESSMFGKELVVRGHDGQWWKVDTSTGESEAVESGGRQSWMMIVL